MPLKFPVMHIAESVTNRILNAFDELRAQPDPEAAPAPAMPTQSATQFSKGISGAIYRRGGEEPEWLAVQSWLRDAPPGARISPESWRMTTSDGAEIRPPPEVEAIRAQYFGEPPGEAGEGAPAVPEPSGQGAALDAQLAQPVAGDDVPPAEPAPAVQGQQVAAGILTGGTALDSMLGRPRE